MRLFALVCGILGMAIGFYQPKPIKQNVDPCQLAGSVFVEPTESFATYRVFVEDVENFADLSVYKENTRGFATRPGHWCFTEVREFADFSVAFVKVKAFADFSICYTEFQSLAGCQQ